MAGVFFVLDMKPCTKQFFCTVVETTRSPRSSFSEMIEFMMRPSAQLLYHQFGKKHVIVPFYDLSDRLEMEKSSNCRPHVPEEMFHIAIGCISHVHRVKRP